MSTVYIQYGFQLNYTPVNTLSGVTASGFFDFSPLLNNDSGVTFDTSDFNAIFNNYNLNRPNSFYQDVDYSTDALIPVNIVPIRNNTAIKANTPDSNYTARRVILPRYEGSRLQSANYNFYTSPTSSQLLLNGDTGSWDGDESFGNTAAIDSRPIYFAHFKISNTQPLIFGTSEFTIDELIEAPFEDIIGTPIEPSTIKVEGNNQNLSETVSTFSKDRDVSVVYNLSINNGVNYKSLAKKSFQIQNPGSEYVLGFTNQKSEVDITYDAMFNRFDNDNFFVTSSFNEILMTTGSGHFNLSGSTNYTASTGPTSYLKFYDPSFGNVTKDLDRYRQELRGPSLSLIHTYNYCVKNEIYQNPMPVLYDPWQPQIQQGILPDDKRSYLKMVPSSSNIPEYEDLEEPFLVERGDEIRVTYNNDAKTYTQDFQVTSVESALRPSFAAGGEWLISVQINGTGSGYNNIDVLAYDKINVTPDPSTLAIPIPEGEIYSFTHRKRRNADDKLMVFTPSPSGSKGALTPSSDGFLIPDDLTIIQKRNVQTLINQLKAKNAFRNDSDNNINP